MEFADKPGQTPQTSEAWPIVGIGASAGGLEAVTQLLQHLPASTGMGFVLIQHLDPHHTSELAELLGNQTTMPVKQASEGITVLPNHLYVIPPNTQMAIHKGVLHLTPRAEVRGRYLPIDHFLRSLAEDRQSRAIGIILSGVASDGTIGLEAIKGEGGITFAQDEGAKFDGMPRSAISAGVVNFVLPPDAIARELAVIAQSFYFGGALADTPFKDGPVLEKILSMLRERVGVDFAHYKAATIHRRMARRLALHHLDNLEAYLALLKQNPGELEALFDDVLITVTEFFRDPEVYDALVEKVFPLITKGLKPDEPIRVWVSGCASGKEAYSIAICFIEYLERTGLMFPVQIFGTDLSERAIETARLGKYPDNIASSISSERLKRFFMKVEGGYQVASTIRALCVFSRQDVTTDPPLARMHLISCRNLLIYLEPVLQRRVLAMFSYALRKKGWLLLGSSETPGALSDYFDVLDAKHKIYRRNLQAAPRIELPPRAPVFKPGHASQPAVRLDDTTVLNSKADRLLLAEYAPSGFLLNAEWQVVKFRGDVGPYLAPQPGDPTLDVVKLVREDIALLLKSGLEEASRTDAIVRKERIPVQRDGRFQELNLVIRPIADPEMERHFLLLFEQMDQQTQHGETAGDGPNIASESQSRDSQDLAFELASTRTYMQRVIEELRSTNEEAQSVNEELQSTNEELQTAKEELQSSNEELNTTNDEMQSRNRELTQVNNDLINVLSSMQTPIVLLNRELQIRRYTPVSEKMVNLIPTDVGRPISHLRTRIKVPDLEELLTEVISSARAIEREVQDVDGRWYLLRVQPYRTAESRVEGAVLQLLDIDQLKRTLAQVEHARNYAEAIIATVREPLLVLDQALRVQTANRSFFETFRVSAEETLNRSVYELGSGQWNLPKIQKMLDSLLQGSVEGLQDIEVEHEFTRIGWRTFQLSARCINSEGERKLILLALEDCTDRKKAAEAKYRRLFETAKDGIVIIDAETGDITDVNPFMLELFGYERSELVGKRFWEGWPLQDIPEGRTVLRRLHDEEVVRFPDLTLEAKDGQQIETDVIGNVYKEGDKRVIQLNIRDITERTRLQQQLQHAAKLESLGVLAGGIAHDFNNLLTAIMGNATLTLAAAPIDTPYQRALKEVVQASHRAADLTRQMLAYAGKGRFVVLPTDISELVRDITALLRTSVPKSVEMELHLADDLPAVVGDASQLQQVIMNLVINGAEAIGEGERGYVRITTSQEQLDAENIRRHFPADELRPGMYIALEITDSGCGMDEATQAKIFDPFFTTKFTGRGLGLAAVQGIVRGHHGAICVDSTTGRGSTFKVLLPAASLSRLVSQQTLPRAEDLHGSGLVLVVDDEDMVLNLAKPALERYGYGVLTATNAEIALGLLRERRHELKLVILDLTMPIMGGEEALAHIKATRPDLPVLPTSGYDAVEAMARFGDKELAGFLQKPFTLEKLATAVKAALSPGR